MRKDKTLMHVMEMLVDSKKNLNRIWDRLSLKEKINMQRRVIRLHNYVSMMCKSK